MFENCSSLTKAPALPAMTLAKNCYGHMFYGCTSLTTAPALPATNLAESCYASMFYGCTSLTTAPALPATTLASYCYWQMFEKCSKLNSITVHFTNWNDDYNHGWVTDVPAGGTFHCPNGLPHDGSDHGDSKIPAGWTVETF